MFHFQIAYMNGDVLFFFDHDYYNEYDDITVLSFMSIAVVSYVSPCIPWFSWFTYLLKTHSLGKPP